MLLHCNPFQQWIFISCKEHLPYMQTSNTNFHCKSVLLLHPIESFVIFLSKFVLLARNTSGPNPTVRIYIGPMGRDHSHRDYGHDSSASSSRVWQLDRV